jgi:hypothetical protein
MAFDEAKFARYGLLGGLAFTVLMFVSSFIAGSPPKLNEVKKIQEYFVDNKDQLRIGAYLGGLAGLLFLWFLGSLYGKLRAVEGGTGRLSRVALIGGIVGVATAFIGNAITANTALHSEFGPEGGYRLASIIFGYGLFAIAAFVSATAIVLWSTGTLPKLFGYAGEAIAVLALVGAGSVATETDAIFYVAFVAFVAFGIWVAALSVMLYRQEA